MASFANARFRDHRGDNKNSLVWGDTVASCRCRATSQNALSKMRGLWCPLYSDGRVRCSPCSEYTAVCSKRIESSTVNTTSSRRVIPQRQASYEYGVRASFHLDICARRICTKTYRQAAASVDCGFDAKAMVTTGHGASVMMR